MNHWPALWAACFLAGATSGDAAAHNLAAGWGNPAVARLAAALPLLLAWRRVRGTAVLAVVLLLAAGWGGGRATHLAARPPAVTDSPVRMARRAGGEDPFLVRLTGYAAPHGSGGWSAPAVVVAAPGGAPDGPASGEGVMLRAEGAEPFPGAVVAGLLRWRPPSPARLPGGFDDRDYLAGRGLRWRTSADSVVVLAAPAAGSAVGRLRSHLVTRLQRLLPPREARLAAAVLWGARTPDSRREASAFGMLGLAHLFAVSGLHVGLVAACLVLPLRAAALPPTPAAVLLTAALGAYMLLTGLPGSVVRAGGAVILATVSAAAGRRPDGLRLLGLLYWGTVLWDPSRALDTGACLSYLAAAGILTALRITGRAAAGARQALVAAAVVSIAAQWATLPVVAAAFGRINLWATPANVVAVPAFGAAVWLTAAALVIDPLLPTLATWVGAAAWIVLRGLAGLVATAAESAEVGVVGLPVPRPGSAMIWLALTVGMAMLLAKGGLLRRLVPLLLVAGLLVLGPAGRAWPPRGGPLVMQFDVGQADCGLVAFPDGWIGLIDTGPGGRRGAGDTAFARDVAPWLRRQGVKRLDAVFLTHGHRDHTGGAEALGGEFGVGTWWGGGTSGRRISTGPGPWRLDRSPRTTVHRWREWELAELDPLALGPAPHEENDASLVLVLSREGEAVMVWSGDLEQGGEARLLAAGLVPGGTEVWKAGHHGSNTSGGKAFLEKLDPDLVLISCGADNTYGHPNHGAYVVAGDTLVTLRTDLNGTIRLHWPGDGPARLDTARPGF